MLRKNGTKQTRIKGLRQKVAKRPVAGALPAAKGLEGVEKEGKQRRRQDN